MSTPDPERLLSRVRAFNEARVLLTASELDLFSALTQQPATASALAERRGFELRPLTLLLDALTALGLLEKSAGTYSCTEEARALLDRESPTSILPMMLHQAHLWQRWSALTSYVDPTRPSLDWNHLTAAFIGAMHATARAHAPEIAAAVGVGAARRLLDVGGASGTYTEAFLATSPDLRATIFDRPEVVELARVRLSESPYVKRITLAPGDFLSDPLPTGHDLALLSAIIHSCSTEEVRALLRAVWEALVPGGRIVIRDYVMNTDRTAPVGGALFAINMLVNTGGGSTYTYDEIRGWLEEAGFERVRTVSSTETMCSLVEASRP